jgi:hypothetical protein
MAVSPHESEDEGGKVVELGQFIAAEADDHAGVHGDEQRAVRVVQGGAQPGFFRRGKVCGDVGPEGRQHGLAVVRAIMPDT